MLHVPSHRSLLSVTTLLVALIAAPIFAQPPQADFQMMHAGEGLSLHKEMFMLPLTLSDDVPRLNLILNTFCLMPLTTLTLLRNSKNSWQVRPARLLSSMMLHVRLPPE